MKRIVLALTFVLCSMVSHAQSKDFEQVYEACVLLQSSMRDKLGSNAEISRAAELLNGAQWSYLRMNIIEGEGEAKFGKESIVFTPEYLQKFSQDKTLVYKKAKQYAAEGASPMRGNEKPVQLCTKCIDANGKVVYGTRQEGSFLNVAAVAEVNGLINLSVKLKDRKGSVSGPYKIASNEFRGMPYRKLPKITMKEGVYEVYITIENKYEKSRTVAVIVESGK